MKSKCQPSEFIFTPKITEHEQDVAANRVHENRNENISMFAQKCNEKHNWNMDIVFSLLFFGFFCDNFSIVLDINAFRQFLLA